MASVPGELPISLRPWSSNINDNDPKHLPSIIRRINFERGGFQNITEESLRQEIAELETNNEDGDDDGSSEDDEEEPDRAKELLAARDEIIMQIDQAHQAAMMSTEVISAALSKETPVQASGSMSQELRSLIGTGTLGMDKLNAPRITKTLQEENKKSAKGWKIQGLNKTVDSILAAAERLKTEVEHETIFWGQVLAISDNHWAVCRLPYDKHTLGVRFGFSEASSAFRDRSLGALRRAEDGTITLDQGLANAEPQILRARVRTGDVETGVSKVPKPVAEDAPIESLILEARNTIFSQELWQELNREARTLAAYGVRSEDDFLVLPLSAAKTIVLDLVSLGDSSSESSGTDDDVAEGVTIAFNLLLNLAHRKNHRKRTQPPASISDEKQSAPPYTLLRPFLTRLKHQETVSNIHTLLRPLCLALKLVLPDSSPKYNLKTTVRQLSPDYPEPEQVLMRLTENLEAVTIFTITEEISMNIIARSQTSQISSSFFVETSPALGEFCPSSEKPYNTFPALREYIEYAVACGLASTMSGPPPTYLVTPLLPDPNDGWQITAQSNILKKALPNQKSKLLAIQVRSHWLSVSGRQEQGAKIRATWQWGKGVILDEVCEKIGEMMGAEIFETKKGTGRGVTHKGQGWYEWTVKTHEEWDDGEGEVVKSLLEIMEDAGA